MSTLAIPPPFPLPAFRREPHWDLIRSSAHSLPRLDTRNALPSIRELVPEHLLNSQPQERSSAGSKTLLTSPASAGPLQTSPGYTHAPHGQKRRRLSGEENREPDRARQVPRLYHPSESSTYSRRESPQAAVAVAASAPAPTPAAPRPDGYYSDVKARPSSSGNYPTSGKVERPDLRHPVSSLTPATRPFERDGHSPYRADGGAVDGYHSRAGQPSAPGRAPSIEQPASSSYRGDYAYSSFQPSNRYASAPSSATTYERTPFTAPPYSMQYGEYSRFGGEMGPAGLVGETKQRKRRGNLPKETTDKLRAWFVAHLQHPYPTEDEKQELMRQTGLQMNQISNWFINARRRQLPNMINDARAESEAMSGRSLSKSDLGQRYERGSRDHLSDGEGRHYEEDLRLRRAHAQSRDSI
ncbi:hypothetical protein NLU13_6099 [Sarocladium strictum]|uniref:Homeobox domain-containing protein n=1 Tax=Sarocladium strictum TaxID=5046 RepID=A0AA39GHN1_SARSR|nr:hypothetical protein NLU13_6099 [Sarocladium strictum]